MQLSERNLAGRSVEELAAKLTQRNIPFAFVTGYGREALPLGFKETVMLRKPFSQDELVATVELLVYQAPGVIALRPHADQPSKQRPKSRQ